MMTFLSSSDVLDRLRAAGVNVIADGDRLILRPARNVPGDLVPILRQRKLELIEATRREILDELARHELDAPEQIELTDRLEAEGWPRVELMRIMAEHVIERATKATRPPSRRTR